MAEVLNFKKDLREKLLSERYYLERELVWIYDNEPMTYKERLEKFSEILGDISDIDNKLLYLEKYLVGQKKDPSISPNQLEFNYNDFNTDV